MKKSTKVLIWLLALVIVIGAAVWIFIDYKKSQFLKPNDYRVELPQGIDFNNLTPEGLQDLIDAVNSKFPSKKIQGLKDELNPIIRSITLTKNGKPIPTPTPTEAGNANANGAPANRNEGVTNENGGDGADCEDEDNIQDTYPGPENELETGRIFVTSGKWDGNLGGLSGADARCREEKIDNRLKGTWEALLSTSTINMKDRVPNTIFKNMAGEEVARDKNDLFDGTISAPILLPDGEATDKPAWTGSDSNASGGASNATCASWTKNVVDLEGKSIIGYPNKIDDDWLVDSVDTCNNAHKIYCVKTKKIPQTSYFNGPTIYLSYDVGEGQTVSEAKAGRDKLKTLIDKYYPKIAELYGDPHKASERNIRIYYAKNYDNMYIWQWDMLLLNSTDPWTVIPYLVWIFNGKYNVQIPETWKYGISYAVADLAIRQFPEDKDATVDWVIQNAGGQIEKYNNKDYPIYGADLMYENDIMGGGGETMRIFLARGSLIKPYIYDSNFFKNLNQKFYSLPLNSSIWNDNEQVFSAVSSVFPNIEGDAPNIWYQKQHLLHQTEFDLGIFGSEVDSFLAQPNYWGIQAYSYKADVSGSLVKFIPVSGRNHSISVSADNYQTVGSKYLATDASGKIQTQFSDYGLSADGRYLTDSSRDNTRGIHFNYYSSGIVPEKLIGAVLGFGSGKITAYDQNGNQLEEVNIVRGAFSFITDMEGIIKLKIKDYNGVEVAEVEVAKDRGGYFTVIETGANSFPPTRGRGEEDECREIDTSNWQTFEQAGLEMKYPSDWNYTEERLQEYTTQWIASFTPESDTPYFAPNLVRIGFIGMSLEEFKQNLTTDFQPGFTIEEETNVVIDGQLGTRLKVMPEAADHAFYIYYVPYHNLAYVFQGPAVETSTIFKNCEPEIYERMIGTFKFPQGPAGATDEDLR